MASHPRRGEERISYVDKQREQLLFLQSKLDCKLEEVEQLAYAMFVLPYLQWMLEQHSYIKITLSQSKTVDIPLDRIYVTLRRDSTTAYERYHVSKLVDTELEQLLGGDTISDDVKVLRWRLLAKVPIITNQSQQRGRNQRKSQNKTKQKETSKDSFTLGHAFRLWRWMVILGDPGSGKTNIVQWLAIQMAEAMINSKLNVITNASKTDIRASVKETLDLGPTRFPVLFRVSEFAQKYREKACGISLIDFLGYHTWMGHSPKNKFGEPIDKAILNSIIRWYLLQGKAVILMDGLDEITAADERVSIVEAIENFMEDWIHICPHSVSPERNGVRYYTKGSNSNLLKVGHFLDDEPPVFKGGNQIVITSRIVGYHAAPLTGNLTHLIIEPLIEEAICKFSEYWVKEIDSENEEKNSLKLQLTHPLRKDLASNMLILNILALVHHNQKNSMLPKTRVQLYHATLEQMLLIWKRKIPSLTISELIHVLAPLAAYIHENYSTGLIEETELAEIVKKHLASFHMEDVKNPSPFFLDKLAKFLSIIRNEVGILVARGEFLYGFIHLTFQEYLAGRYLVWDKNKATEMVMSKLYDPRWVESIRMALGWVSWKWPQSDFENFLLSVLSSDNSLNGILPNAAVQISSSYSEFVNPVIQPVLEGVARQLLNVVSNNNLITSTSIQEEVKSGLSTIPTEILICIFENNLKTTTSPTMAMAIARLVKELSLFTPVITKSLLRVLKYDKKEANWPIDDTLRTIALDKKNFFPAKSSKFKKTL